MPTTLWPLAGRFVKPLACVAVIAAPALPAHAAEQRLRDEALRALFAGGALLCEAPQAGRCAAIVRWDGSEGLRETRLETMGGEPVVDMAMQFPVRVQDDQVCLTVRGTDIGYLFIVGGEERAGEQAARLREPVARVWSGAEGRTWCTAYYRDTQTGAFRAEVRIDGAPRLDLDSTFQPITTSPLPQLRMVRQPWTIPVLRAAGALVQVAEAPAAPAAAAAAPEPTTPVETADLATTAPPSAAAPQTEPVSTSVAAAPTGAPDPTAQPAPAASPTPVTEALCDPNPSRLARLRSWMRLGGGARACAAQPRPR